MKKSKIKILIKAALITFGLLCMLAGTINPITYYFGTETTSVIDDSSYEKTADDLYSFTADYHYFAKAKEYSGTFSIKGPLDESLPYDMHPVKYLPFYPGYGVVTTEYSLPLKSIILFSAGLVSFIAGLFIKTQKSGKITKKDSTSLPLYLCPACECEIDKDSIFCNYCGRKILKKG